MKFSRRDLSVMLGGLAAAFTARAQSGSGKAAPAAAATEAAGVEKLPVLKTMAYRYNELKTAGTDRNVRRSLFTAKTHTGFKMESHMSDLAPGESNHPPHQHLREEMMLVREGTMQLTIKGVPYKLGPGDVGLIGSNEIHNATNVGNTIAKYFIVNIGRDDV